MQDKAFNLLYEPWLIVLNKKGESEELSLLTVLERAHEFRRLAGELPTQDIAVLRLLLAVLYATFTRVDVQGNRKKIGTAPEAMERWRGLWELGSFPIDPIRNRLGYYEERFFLFHPERPFYQVAGLDKGTDYSGAKLLGNISESGNKVRLFPVRTGKERYSLTYAEAARWLIYLNAFDDTSSKPSVRGQKMPSPGAGWLGKLGLISAEGKNLFETLMLNFVLLNKERKPWENGLAAWEVDDQSTEERSEIVLPQDFLTILTLQSRRLLLQRDGDFVTGYRLLGGDFFPKENSLTEQMTLWRKDKKGDEYNPRRHDPSRQMWRDFSVLLAEDEKNTKSGIVRWLSLLKDEGYIEDMMTLQIAGVKYGDKDFFVTNVFDDSLTVNANMISKLGQEWIIHISRLLNLTEICVTKLGFLAADLARASGDSDSLHHKAGANNGAAKKTEAYYRLDEPFRRWLENIDPLQTDVAKAESVWKDTVKRILLQLGEEMTLQSGEKAITGRWVKDRLFTAPGAFAKFRANVVANLRKGG